MPNDLYLLIDGHCLMADGPTDFVNRMRAMSRSTREDTSKDFKESVSNRCFIYDESIIRTDTDQEFLDDLIANNFVLKINLN